MKSIKGVLIDVEKKTCEVKEVEKSLESYYKILNCNNIDITVRNIDGKSFDIICDDEGLLKQNPKPSAINNDVEKQILLVGNLFVVQFDGKSDVTSLSDSEISHIINNVRYVYYEDKENNIVYHYPILTNVNS